MTEAEFQTISLLVGLTVLMGFMAFIIYDLGKKAKVTPFGMFVLYLALFVGPTGFIIKTILVELMGQ